jgi:hypothetical protein
MKDGDTITLPSGVILQLHIKTAPPFLTRTLMDRASRDKWIKALRSGEYKQGRNVLRDMDSRYCCLGVKAEIDGWPFDCQQLCYEINRSVATISLPVNYEQGLDSCGPFCGFWLSRNGAGMFSSLAGLNDAGYSFEDIAHIIELLF